MKITSLILFLLFNIPLAHSDVKLAFFQIYKPDGSVMQLEKGGRFAHIAISVETGWLHVHPYRGVEVVKSLSGVGFKDYKVKIFSSNREAIVYEDYKKYYGLPYDPNYSWDESKIYCSELIAKILGIKPTPMSFDSEVWGVNHAGRGELGISPDEIYEAIVDLDFYLDKLK